jgi:hypothetical protein
MADVYPWAESGGSSGGHAQGTHWYLNPAGFLTRTVIYFGIWIGLAQLLNRWSESYAQTEDPAIGRRIRSLSGVGLPLYVLSMTFASVDWVMSLEPRWYSTIYGLMAIAGQVLATLAFVIVMSYLIDGKTPTQEGDLHDLGNLILAFVMLWAYLAFSQYLIIWSGNLPEEITWYLRRSQGPWGPIALVIIVFHFAVPFLLLLSRTVKRKATTLFCVAFGILVMRWIDTVWLINPAFSWEGFPVHWMDLGLTIGIGGIWLALYLRQLDLRLTLSPHASSYGEPVAER